MRNVGAAIDYVTVRAGSCTGSAMVRVDAG